MENKQRKSIYCPVKANMINRVAAFFLDFVLFVILVTGSLFITAKIANFDSHNDILHEQYREIGYEKFNEETNEWYYISEDDENFNIVIEKYKKNEIIQKEESYINSFVLNAPLLCIFIAMFIVEILLPLIFKNGQTLGMKCLKVAFISNNQIAVKPLQVFIRGLFGKIVLMGLIPFMGLFFAFFNPNGGLSGTLIIVLIYGIHFVMLFASKNKSSLSDMIGQMYAVDYNQTIFYKNIEELNKAKEMEDKTISTQKKVY